MAATTAAAGMAAAIATLFSGWRSTARVGRGEGGKLFVQLG